VASACETVEPVPVALACGGHGVGRLLHPAQIPLRQSETRSARIIILVVLSIHGLVVENSSVTCKNRSPVVNGPILEIEAKAKLERLGVPTEQDFTLLKADPAFTGFLGAIGLVYEL
jgi:hypothetical protein